MTEITDEMRLKAMEQAREAALKTRDKIQKNTEEESKKDLSPEEIQQIIKENQERALYNKKKIEKKIEGTNDDKPTTDELLEMRKEMMEDVYTEMKKYKSLSQLKNEGIPINKISYDEKIYRQVKRKKNIGHYLGKIYD